MRHLQRRIGSVGLRLHSKHPTQPRDLNLTSFSRRLWAHGYLNSIKHRRGAALWHSFSSSPECLQDLQPRHLGSSKAAGSEVIKGSDPSRELRAKGLRATIMVSIRMPLCMRKALSCPCLFVALANAYVRRMHLAWVPACTISSLFAAAAVKESKCRSQETSAKT